MTGVGVICSQIACKKGIQIKLDLMFPGKSDLMSVVASVDTGVTARTRRVKNKDGGDRVSEASWFITWSLSSGGH